jgi:hypothetical protein
MNRQLSQCPYCQACEIALDDEPRIVFNPDAASHVPCGHLVWVDGRYSQWERTKYGTSRVIGSTEFRWDHPGLGGTEDNAPLTDYLRELADSGRDWPFAPSATFEVRQISADQKATDRKGKEYTVWDVDGWAIFAQNAPAFGAQVPDCLRKQLAGLKIEADDK